MVSHIRKSSQIPLVLFSYYNPILQMGLETFAAAASGAGVDGVLATDLSPEESVEYRRILAMHHLDTIFLCAPTSTDERLASIAECSSGFLYLVSRTSVTGAKDTLPDDLRAKFYEASYCCRFRNFASGARYFVGRAGRCCRSGVLFGC
jgi:tryptophan synthase alpha chain